MSDLKTLAVTMAKALIIRRAEHFEDDTDFVYDLSVDVGGAIHWARDVLVLAGEPVPEQFDLILARIGIRPAACLKIAVDKGPVDT